MTEFAKHRGRHKWGVVGGTREGDTNYYGCIKCGKEYAPPVVPPVALESEPK